MQSVVKIFLGVVAMVMAVVLMPSTVSAQTSSINAYSPYSMYGPGELLTPGTVQMRSMGGVGIAVRALGQVNVLNPAAHSVVPSKSFLFDVSFDGTHFRNNQAKYDSLGAKRDPAKTVYNTINIHNIYLSFPVAKGLGASVSVAPYSSVGYKMSTISENEENWADIGRVMYGYGGEGDISEVKFALGWEPWRNFSIGVAAKYYWGYIERNYTASITNVITGTGTYSSTNGVDKYIVNNLKFQAGLQWNIIYTEDEILTLGATYDLGGRLNPEKQSYVYTNSVINSIQSHYLRQNIDNVELRVPHQVGVGVFYRNREFALGADYNYAAWGGGNASYEENASAKNVAVRYIDTHDIKLGFELTPRSSDVRNYLNRMSYRAGIRLGNYYQTFGGQRINKLAVTLGVGLPVKVWGASSVNVGFEYGRMSSPNTIEVGAQCVGLVTQNYYKISVGFSLFSADTSDYWFVRQKYD